MDMITNRTLRIKVVEHKTTHLLIAVSDDLPGFTLAARSEDQVLKELPAAIQEWLEAQGETVVSITATPGTGVPDAFIQHDIVANVRTGRAAA